MSTLTSLVVITSINNVVILVQIINSIKEMDYEPFLREPGAEITSKWIQKVESIVAQIKGSKDL